MQCPHFASLCAKCLGSSTSQSCPIASPPRAQRRISYNLFLLDTKTRTWPRGRLASAIDMAPTLDQPWTPPDTEDDTSPRHDYFNLCSSSFRFDTPTKDAHVSRPKPDSRLTEPLPYTPTRPYESHPAAPRYPYTPDSSRILRRRSELPTSPTPWDEYSESSSSPVQNALSSCIAHFENLIQTRQPDEHQMEYIVAQFEAMAAHLSAPEAQSKKTDEELFADPADHGLGITQTDDAEDAHSLLQARTLHHDAYVGQVGTYVASVQKYIYDLKMRMDEVKTLNSIQLDVINDLRKQMKTVRQSMRDELERAAETDETDTSSLAHPEHSTPDSSSEAHDDFGTESWETLVEDEDQLSREIHMEYSKLLRNTVDKLTADPPIAHRRRLVTIVRKPPRRRGFWAAFGEAVDAVSMLLLED
ncbi:hypothetical protein BDW02DRAFT_577602 [Decorospora gaudefroyi]|uniref:Uncharacterized protein n=1 Tax=Decorospora gaudefroyi TaxID=184978 RepID=A0A6A5KM13_9PLEO|nr:hypothetical protein BDW02DRAFT_577602 [Decorospora gaudefroyi]